MVWLCTANGWMFDGVRMTLLAQDMHDLYELGGLLRQDQPSERFQLFAFKNTGWMKSQDLGYVGLNVVLLATTPSKRQFLTEVKVNLPALAKSEEYIEAWHIVYEQMRKSKARDTEAAAGASVDICKATAKALYGSLLRKS